MVIVKVFLNANKANLIQLFQNEYIVFSELYCIATLRTLKDLNPIRISQWNTWSLFLKWRLFGVWYVIIREPERFVE